MNQRLIYSEDGECCTGMVIYIAWTFTSVMDSGVNEPELILSSWLMKRNPLLPLLETLLFDQSKLVHAFARDAQLKGSLCHALPPFI